MNLLSLLLALHAHASIAPPAEAINAPTIRVSLGSFPRFGLSGQDLRLNGSAIFEGESAFTVRCGIESDGTNYVEYGAGRRTPEKLEVAAPSGFFQLNGKLYRARLTVTSRDGRCQVVNSLDLDKYLAGLLNKEMSPHWPLEALKAQAVASRSYALQKIRMSQEREFDLESSTQDQVYDGAGSETMRSSQAVMETQGLVLMAGDHALKAYFHANCGGKTEVPSAVWGNDSKDFVPVACPYHNRKRDRQSWKVHLTKAQIENAVRRIVGLVPIGFRQLASLHAGPLSINQRLRDVTIADSRGDRFRLPAQDFRAALGNTKVKSTSFKILPDGAGYRLEGQGYGHGVGMCQVGARAMAELGKTFRQILTYYYPLAKIKRL